LFFYLPPIPLVRNKIARKRTKWKGIRRIKYKLNIFFKFYGKKIRRTKGSKYNTNNIT